MLPTHNGTAVGWRDIIIFRGGVFAIALTSLLHGLSPDRASCVATIKLNINDLNLTK